jgi:hypothetical protein
MNADEVFHAWMSADLPRMLAARALKSNPIDRHFLLQGIVKATYATRSDSKMRQLCIESGRAHLGELATIVRALKAEFQGELPRVPAEAWLATALAEIGKIDEAVTVCETAASLGIFDGTKAGYLGRAERLRKKRSQLSGN